MKENQQSQLFEFRTDTTRVENPTRVGHVEYDEYDVYVGRNRHGEGMDAVQKPGKRGYFGNPYTLREFSRAEAIEKFKKYFKSRLKSDPVFRQAVESLHGKVLACHCQRLEDRSPACHAEVIAEWSDKLHSGVEVKSV